ncbi:putative late blight resistance protein homolog R1A-3 [Salvia splendens]|uniref:putative late blight resistance protein homolog R1A-3 n=1 Tax=Salvia splendens TaxID=180675 RepID=UPI001C259E44|nr:putative late blight resistance protein homolog R1A-3 [Salvia splendens]XP_042052362.1 putative late blight resistance protein homolog R1A-3 [Salvia splendens]
MAAYGALVSLMHIIETLQKHPSPPISIDTKQVESITQIVTFLLEFLDAYISPVVVDGRKADPLERRIADAVYAAEDVIESNVVLNIHKPFTMHGKMISFINSFRGVRKSLDATATIEPSIHGKRAGFLNLFRGVCRRTSAAAEKDLYRSMQKVIKEMNLIKKEAMEIEAVAQLRRKASSIAVGSLTSSSIVKENMMVGFDEVFLEVLDKLTGNQLSREIIPIMGMGGIGKTTLARNLFENALVKEHFDIRAWTTISQTYNVRETLREVVFQASGDSSSDLSEEILGEKLYKFLYGRRYLVIMDDMWSVDAWEKIKVFFPDNGNGSRIIVTTRLSNLSSQLNESNRVGMNFLDEANSWDLFCKTVFGKEGCPFEFEKIGKNIVENCKGLPLSIITIGALLAKSQRTREYWKLIEQNLNSTVITTNDEFCLKILRMSYIYLPNYLKPCFLYMGVFGEDSRIRVSMLEKLWVSEGFLKPRSGKCLETIAQENLKELVDRNLVLVEKLGSIGNIKYCKMHDLLRDLCLKEVETERFYHVLKQGPLISSVSFLATKGLLISDVLESLSRARRVVLNDGYLFHNELWGSFSHARSIICDYYRNSGWWVGEVRQPHNLRLLRTFKAYNEDDDENDAYLLDNVFELVNSRYLAVKVSKRSEFPSSVDLLWNLHTLIIHGWGDFMLPIEIWKLHQLQHLVFGESRVILPDLPPIEDNSEVVIMENLQTLKGVKNLILNEEVVKRIPNVKKLCLSYDHVKQVEGEKCVSYLQCLSKLENFRCSISDGCGKYLHSIRIPHSLNKLSISSDDVELEYIMSEIGSLPHLEKFVLQRGCFTTGKWETIEGQFQSLKFLRLDYCGGLKDWIVSDKSHFPILQKLHLHYLHQLSEIPSEIGEILTLRSIELDRCSKSVVESAKKIVEEQEDLYGDQLDLHVLVKGYKVKAPKSLANANFEVVERF